MLTNTEFYGHDLTDMQCEVLLLERYGVGDRVFRKHLKKELNLFQTKWFDYRILHPVVATYLYAAEFVRVYKAYYAKTIDYHKSFHVKGFSGKDAWNAKSPAGFVKGRQQADSMGIPYWFYIENAYEWLYIKKWKHLPRHVHLYNAEVIEFVEAKWQTRIRETLIVAESDFFKNHQLNQGKPEYIAHQEWLMDRVSLSTVPDLAMESLRERGFLV